MIGHFADNHPRPPCSSRSAAEASSPSLPYTRKRRFCTRPRSPASARGRIRSARSTLRRWDAGPGGRRRSVFLLLSDRAPPARVSDVPAADAVRAGGLVLRCRSESQAEDRRHFLNLSQLRLRRWEARRRVPVQTAATDRRSTVRCACRFWRRATALTAAASCPVAWSDRPTSVSRSWDRVAGCWDRLALSEL